MNKMKKTIYLLNVGDYAPEITALTYPFIRYCAIWRPTDGTMMSIFSEVLVTSVQVIG
jgi:hypothetical protein